jgi:hypothetical protein
MERYSQIRLKSIKTLLPRLNSGLRFSTGIRQETLSRDPAHLDSLEDLNLVRNFVTIRLYLEAVNAAKEIVSAPVIDYRVLFAHGDADEVTSYKIA